MYVVLTGSVKLYMTTADFNSSETQVVDTAMMRQQLFEVQDLLETVKSSLYVVAHPKRRCCWPLRTLTATAALLPVPTCWKMSCLRDLVQFAHAACTHPCRVVSIRMCCCVRACVCVEFVFVCLCVCHEVCVACVCVRVRACMF